MAATDLAADSVGAVPASPFFSWKQQSVSSVHRNGMLSARERKVHTHILSLHAHSLSCSRASSSQPTAVKVLFKRVNTQCLAVLRRSLTQRTQMHVCPIV